jgi:hypothetical protein
VKNWVLKTEVNGSTSDGKIASLPLMTRSLILGLDLMGKEQAKRAGLDRRRLLPLPREPENLLL